MTTTTTVTVRVDELRWLVQCTDSQMADGHAARLLATVWLQGKSAQPLIDNCNLKYGQPRLHER